MTSSSSVVTPGRMAAPAASTARAAMRPAARMRSMSSGVYTSPWSERAGAALPTYSGRGMLAGTGRTALTRPGTRRP